jgi:hypothetical protein
MSWARNCSRAGELNGRRQKTRVAIVAGILVARHLKNTEDLHDSRPSPRTESLIASAVQWGRSNYEKGRRSLRGFHRCKTWAPAQPRL